MEIEKIVLLRTDECEAFIKEANDLRNMVKLEEDPVSTLGFLGINKQLANLQAAKERLTDLLLKSITNKSNAQRLVSNAKGSYGIAYNTVMTTDVDVISQTSKEKREAAAAVKVQDDYKVLQQAEDSLAEAIVFNQVISTIAKDLENKQDLLLKQIDLIRMSMQIHPEVKDAWTANGSMN